MRYVNRDYRVQTSLPNLTSNLCHFQPQSLPTSHLCPPSSTATCYSACLVHHAPLSSISSCAYTASSNLNLWNQRFVSWQLACLPPISSACAASYLPFFPSSIHLTLRLASHDAPQSHTPQNQDSKQSVRLFGKEG